eukprot:gene26156-13986_t
MAHTAGGPFDPTFDRVALAGGVVADVTVATVQGQRGSQEDAHLIHSFTADAKGDGAVVVGDGDAVMVGVYDGHGGSFVSTYVAQNMVRCLDVLAAKDPAGGPSSPGAWFAAAYQMMDAELIAGAEPVVAAAKAVGPRMRNPARKVQKMGTTALTVVVATFDSEKTLFW